MEMPLNNAGDPKFQNSVDGKNKGLQQFAMIELNAWLALYRIFVLLLRKQDYSGQYKCE